MYAYHPNTKLFLSLLKKHRKAPKGTERPRGEVVAGPTALRLDAPPAGHGICTAPLAPEDQCEGGLDRGLVADAGAKRGSRPIIFSLR